MATITLIANVNVFDGMNGTLIEKADVLVESNKIKTIPTKKIEASGVLTFPS